MGVLAEGLQEAIEKTYGENREITDGGYDKSLQKPHAIAKKSAVLQNGALSSEVYRRMIAFGAFLLGDAVRIRPAHGKTTRLRIQREGKDLIQTPKPRRLCGNRF